MLGVAVALVVGLLLFCWALYTAYLEYVHRKYAHIPRPEPFNFYLGHVMPIAEVTGRKQQSIDALMLQWCAEYGTLFVVFFFHNALVVTLNQNDCKTLLMSTKAYKPPEVYEAIARPLRARFTGYGLVTEPYYDKWKEPRRHFDPFFSKSHLKLLVPQMNKQVDKLVRRIDACADGKTPIDITTQFGITTLDMISLLMNSTDALGVMKRAPSLKGKDVVEWVQSLHDCAEAIQLSLYPHSIVYNYLHPFKTKHYKDSVAMNRKMGESCIQERMKRLERGEDCPHDLVERILQRINGNSNVTLTELVDDFVTFFGAGFDTTTGTLGFTLAVLLKHPDILARAQEEVSEVLEDRTDITAEDLERLQYIEQVIDETLRVYPSSTGTQRVYPEDIELSGYTIPKGTSILISFYGMLHLPSNFEDPERFDPTRFDRRNARPDPFVYLPFSRGYRSCIGRVFAKIVVKMIIARLVQTFNLHLPKDYEIGMEAHLTLRIRPPPQIIAERVQT